MDLIAEFQREARVVRKAVTGDLTKVTSQHIDILKNKLLKKSRCLEELPENLPPMVQELLSEFWGQSNPNNC